MRENRTSHLDRMKNSSYYIAPVGVRTHDLPHTVASNMVKVSHALNHSATEAVIYMWLGPSLRWSASWSGSGLQNLCKDSSPLLDRTKYDIKVLHLYNSVCACRHIHINYFVSVPQKATKIAVMKCIHWQKAMVMGRNFYIRSISVEKSDFLRHVSCSMDIILSKDQSEVGYMSHHKCVMMK